jgi:hypothetical protein
MNAIKMEKASKQAKTEDAIIKAFFWEHTATPFLSYKLRLLLLWLSPPAIINKGCVLLLYIYADVRFYEWRERLLMKD